MEAADDDGNVRRAEAAREIERARELVRLHADQADETRARRLDATDGARHVDDGVAFVIGLDLDFHIGPEHALSAQAASRPCTLARLFDGIEERRH